jgi:extracellular factor (EF) 3-hydroxypalmitic acid methyl ester biosynthesis protein
VLEDKRLEINEQFRDIFYELEKGHIKLREKLNSLTEQGNELEEILIKEHSKYDYWRFNLMDQLAEITCKFTLEQKEAHKNFIRASKYYEIVQEAPFYWRIMNKPNGYAGDALMMKFIYDNRFEGKTPFGMFLHKHALLTKACQSVRNRKEYLKAQILENNEGKILSLAAGPAQEIKEALEISNGHKFQFLALDHDMDTLAKFNLTTPNGQFTYALANAFQIVSGNYLTAKPRNLMLKYCHPRKDFIGLRRFLSALKYEINVLEKKTFSLVYSAGLYDYIRTFLLDETKGTIALTKNLFDLVMPGGSLIVGNFNHNNPRDLKFVMEYIYDWELIYRKKHDVIEFARAIPEKEIDNINIIEEPLGINYFLKIKKKQFGVEQPSLAV